MNVYVLVLDTFEADTPPVAGVFATREGARADLDFRVAEYVSDFKFEHDERSPVIEDEGDWLQITGWEDGYAVTFEIEEHEVKA